MAQNEIAVALRLVADQFKSELTNLQGGLGGFTGALGKFATDWKTAAGAVLLSLGAITKATASYAEEIDQLSQRTGISTTTLQEWDVALNRVGLTHEDLTRGFKQLAVVLNQASVGAGEGAFLFDRLGISADQAGRLAKNPEQAFLVLADKIAEFADGAGKAELVGKLLGERLGIKLLPLMNGGSAAFAAAAAKAQELGNVLSTDTIASLARLDDHLDDLKTSLTALTHQIGAAFGPELEKIVPFLTTLVSWATTLVQALHFNIGSFGIGLAATLDEIGERLSALTETTKLRLQKLFTLDPETVAALNAQIETLTATTQARIAEIRQDAEDLKIALAARISGIGERPQDTRKSVPDLTDRRPAQERALKAELALAEQVLRERFATARTAAAIEEQIVASSLARRERGETEAAIARTGIHEQENQDQIAALDRFATALDHFYTARFNLGFTDKESRLAFEAEVAKKVSELREKVQGVKAEGLIGTKKDVDAVTAVVEAAQEKIGRMIVEHTQTELRVRKAALADTVTIEEEKVRALEASLAPREAIAERELALLRAKHAQELADETLTVQQITAIRSRQAEELAAKQIEATGGFFANYVQGLKQFVNDTASGLGLARTMAIQTAQAMAQGFQQFFFDIFTGQIQSVKELLRGLLNFALQIISQVAASLATQGLIKGLISFAPSLAGAFGGGGGGAAAGGGAGLNFGPGTQLTTAFTPALPGFQHGGAFRVGGAGGPDSQVVAFRATPGEQVQVGGGAGGVHISVTVNAGGGMTQRGGGGAPTWQAWGRLIAQLIEAKLIDEQRPGGLLDGGAPA